MSSRSCAGAPQVGGRVGAGESGRKSRCGRGSRRVAAGVPRRAWRQVRGGRCVAAGVAASAWRQA
eukprot:4412442-Prymnesium_polylepis.1